MTSKPDRTLRLPWQSKARNVDNSTPKTPRMVSRIEVAKRAHHHAIQARVAARKGEPERMCSSTVLTAPQASQIEVVLPNDFCGVLVVHDAFGQPHLGYLLSQDAREYITSPFAATSPGSALYDVRPQAVVMALVYRSMQAPFRKARRSEDLRDVCEVFADGAAVCVRYAAEARSQDMKNWYESLLSSVLSDRSSD